MSTYYSKKVSQIINCKFNSKYGYYCYRHRKYHLLDENNNIIQNNFTFQKKDYNKEELINFCKKIS